MNTTLYQPHTCCATAAPSELKEQYGQLRYKDFRPDDPYVSLDHKRQVEFDDYDSRESTLLLLATMSKGRDTTLVSGARIMPTTEPNDIEEPSWQYLTKDIELPKSPDVWVCGRWSSIKEKSRHRQICNSLVMLEIHRASIEHGFGFYFGVTTKQGHEWFDKVGIGVEACSPEFFTGRENDSIYLITVRVDDRYVQVAHDKHKEAAMSLRSLAA
ncbi:MAG: hypothetical protein AAF542_18000 [Pseudomonadota bacterium]